GIVDINADINTRICLDAVVVELSGIDGCKLLSPQRCSDSCRVQTESKDFRASKCHDVESESRSLVKQFTLKYTSTDVDSTGLRGVDAIVNDIISKIVAYPHGVLCEFRAIEGVHVCFQGAIRWKSGQIGPSLSTRERIEIQGNSAR